MCVCVCVYVCVIVCVLTSSIRASPLVGTHCTFALESSTSKGHWLMKEHTGAHTLDLMIGPHADVMSASSVEEQEFFIGFEYDEVLRSTASRREKDGALEQVSGW